VLRPIITQQNSISTHVTYVSHFDIKGTVPGSIVSTMGAGQPLLIGTIRDLLTKQSSSSSAISTATLQQQQSRMSLWQRIANGNDKTAPDNTSSNSGSSNSTGNNSCDDESGGYADAVSSDTTVMTAAVGGSTGCAKRMNGNGNSSSSHIAIGSHTQLSHNRLDVPASTTKAIQQKDCITVSKSRITDSAARASTALGSPIIAATAAAVVAITVLVCLAYSTGSDMINTFTLLGVGIAAFVALMQYAAQYSNSKTGVSSSSSSSLCNGQHVFVLHIPAVPLHMLLQHYRSQQHDSSTTVQIGVSHIVVKALGAVVEQYSSSLQQSCTAQSSIALHVVADTKPTGSKATTHDDDDAVTTQSGSSNSSTIQQITVSDMCAINTNIGVNCSSAAVSKPIAVVMTKSHSDDSYRNTTATSCDSDTSSSVASIKHASSSSNSYSSDFNMAFTLPIVPTAKVVVSIGDVQMFSTSTSTVSSRSSSRSTSSASSIQNSALYDQHNTAAANSTAMLQLTVMIDSIIDVSTAHGLVRLFKRYLRNPKRLLNERTTSGIQGDDRATVATSKSVYRNEKSSVVYDSLTTAATVCNGTTVSTATGTAATTTTANAAAPLR
jgi:hypothetical protein